MWSPSPIGIWPSTVVLTRFDFPGDGWGSDKVAAVLTSPPRIYAATPYHYTQLQTLTRKVSAIVRAAVALPHIPSSRWQLDALLSRPPYSIIPVHLLRRNLGTCQVSGCKKPWLVTLLWRGWCRRDLGWNIRSLNLPSRATFRPPAVQQGFVRADMGISRKKIQLD